MRVRWKGGAPNGGCRLHGLPADPGGAAGSCAMAGGWGLGGVTELEKNVAEGEALGM